MQYEVLAVGDDELPEGVDHLVVEQPDGPPVLLINGAPARCWAYMQAFQDMQESCAMPTLLLPRPRMLHAV